jgi:hypothetical protein
VRVSLSAFARLGRACDQHASDRGQEFGARFTEQRAICVEAFMVDISLDPRRWGAIICV